MENIEVINRSDRQDLADVPELRLSDYLEGNETLKDKFTSDLFRGLKNFGFIIIKDHPIPLSLLKKAYELSEKLFALPEETKKSYVSKSGAGQRGYTPFGREHAKDSKFPDLKEFWHVGRNLPEAHPFHQLYPENIWPTELTEFKTTFLELYNQLDTIGLTLLESLTKPLELRPNYFTEMTADGNSILRLLHYPPIPEGVDPHCVRAAAHEDINLLTILVSASASGLELLDRNGKWLAIETEPNNLIVDSGDMLSRITNEKIPSTTHRVVNPAGKNQSRYSMPYFIHPHPEAVLSCLPSCMGDGAKYPDIKAEEFLQQRLQEIGLKSESVTLRQPQQ
ncbi:MAG: isopenicillin N synthase family oxygenase [Bdellovibrionales bacterium]|nr:isopenicillin N synthase family oxygenase [Bdellovibrionales bacterium]